MKNSRRNFLKAAALGVASGQLLKLQRPSLAEAIDKDGKGQAHNKPTGEKIVSIETFANENVCIVRVHTDAGAEGYGQTAPFNADISAMVLHRQIAPHALGKDPGDIDSIADQCIEANYKFPWSYICRALVGVDTALWDIRGNRENKSVCELLGGKPRTIPAYGSSMRRDITPADEADRLARLRDQKGFRAFKVRIGKVCGHDQDQWPGAPNRSSLLSARQLVTTSGCTWMQTVAIRRLKQSRSEKYSEDNSVCHFEEPCPYWELEWTAKVAAALKVPVAGGEQDNDLAQWRRMINMHAVDIVQPDVCYVGGLTRALRVAAMAANANLPCVPHSANLSMVTVFTLHLLGAIRNAGPFMEFSIEPTGWTSGLYNPMPEVRDGKVAIPDGPGWGVTVNPQWLEKAERKISERK